MARESACYFAALWINELRRLCRHSSEGFFLRGRPLFALTSAGAAF